MLPRVILYNSISLDGKIEGDLNSADLYYAHLSELGADCTLVGGGTAELAHMNVRPETKADFLPPPRDPALALMAVTDSQAQRRTYHLLRELPHCREVVALVAEDAPAGNLAYLHERQYPVIAAGQGRVDLRRALEMLHERYGVQVVRTDSGGVLNCALLEAGLATDIVIIVEPFLGGSGTRSLFRTLAQPVPLQLREVKELGSGYVWLHYAVS